VISVKRRLIGVIFSVKEVSEIVSKGRTSATAIYQPFTQGVSRTMRESIENK